MSTMESTPIFDTDALRRGIEGRDVSALRGLYADDAHMTVVDQRDQPSHPHEMTGTTAIGEFLDDVCSRDMEHRLEQVVVSADGSHAAYLEQCRYPDGTRVTSTSMLDLRDGRIAAQTSVQAWDEATAAQPMTQPMQSEHMDFAVPDEIRTFPHGRAEILTMGGGVVGRFTLEPGWRWSQDVKPLAGTEWCEAAHFGYHLSGTLHVRMADGTEFDAQAGDVAMVAPGHDAWVVGDEPVTLVDWQGAVHYAEKQD
ncbi:nuclear transport factor 2 family protein [Streptacidiphilus fuscans]|uniref:Nuclear transport factor 2 family protein n=1 Tax=Streptacidiphilus fuscans TaxID=2789292 RepID=A0A931AWR0_9ACTN|nr:nuclear transport factor 2 family protein [Streptacidiphilus fuscans]MBF9066925.1 nuclear transport factor 2 family protein [Streptacidiphilus fuscans]